MVESRGERKKKMMYRNLLDTSTEDAKRHYNEVKVEAKRVVRRAKNICLVVVHVIVVSSIQSQFPSPIRMSLVCTVAMCCLQNLLCVDICALLLMLCGG